MKEHKEVVMYFLLFYDVVEDFVKNGLVTNWKIRDWKVVIGSAL
jgi:hypothetical protein